MNARVYEGGDSEMQEHYPARLVEHWPSPSDYDTSHPSKRHSKHIAIRYSDNVCEKIAKLHKTRSKKEAPAIFYVKPNDVEQCRVQMRPSMITDSRVAPGSTVSARYIFRGKRVKGWDGFYPCTVSEHCVDGTLLLRYIHETPVHEEYIKCKDIQIPVTIGPDD